MHESDNNTHFVLYFGNVAESSPTWLWGYGGTDNQLLHGYIYIHTHIVMIMDSIHIYMFLY